MTRNLALAAAAVLAASCDGGPASPRIVSPPATSYTNGAVVVAVDRGDTSPARMELLVDGAAAATREVPPWEFPLDTAPLPEGEHEVRVAVLDRAGWTVTTAPVTVVVDRTAPAVASYRPQPGFSVFPGMPLDVWFDEPVEVRAPGDVRLEAGGVPIEAAVSASANRVHVEPASGEVTRVSLSGTVFDRAGNAATLPVHWQGWAYPFAALARSAATWGVSAAVAPDGDALVAWAGMLDGDRFLSLGAQGTGWALAPLPGAYEASTAVGASGELLVATRESPPARRWTGASLVPLGGDLAVVGPVAVAVDPAGVAMLARADDTLDGILLDHAVHVSAWSAGQDAFVESAPPLSLGGRCAARVDVAGEAARPMVRVEPRSCDGLSYDPWTLHVWTGAAWSEAPLPGALAPVKLVAGPAGAPLAVSGSWTAPRLFVWDGAAWQEPWPAPAIGWPAAVAVDASGHPIVVHRGPGGMGVVRHDGTQWVTLAPALGRDCGNTGGYGAAAVAAGTGNAVLVAWGELTDDEQMVDFARWITW